MTTQQGMDVSLDREIKATETGLEIDYPDVQVTVIHTLVAASYERLTPAKVTAFLPLLVTHDVRDQLHASGAA
jgi:hypothetical protein